MVLFSGSGCASCAGCKSCCLQVRALPKRAAMAVGLATCSVSIWESKKLKAMFVEADVGSISTGMLAGKCHCSECQ